MREGRGREGRGDRRREGCKGGVYVCGGKAGGMEGNGRDDKSKTIAMRSIRR